MSISDYSLWVVGSSYDSVELIHNKSGIITLPKYGWSYFYKDLYHSDDKLAVEGGFIIKKILLFQNYYIGGTPEYPSKLQITVPRLDLSESARQILLFKERFQLKFFN